MTADLFVAMRKVAELSADGRYRYTLARVWDTARPEAVFVMLNPSTADADRDDPTIRRCIAFAREWRAGAIVVLNLFAKRATNPNALYASDDPIGPHNDIFVRKELDRIICTRSPVVCAWGTHGAHLDRDRAMLAMIREAGIVPTCLGVTKDGYPRHPLYVAGGTKPIPYLGRAE